MDVKGNHAPSFSRPLGSVSSVFKAHGYRYLAERGISARYYNDRESMQ